MGNYEKFAEAIERGPRFEKENAESDTAMRKHLLAAWKEKIFEEFVAALKGTDDPKHLKCLDGTIALVLTTSR